MMNASRGNVAYTIINTDEGVEPEVIEKLNAMDSVLLARKLK